MVTKKSADSCVKWTCLWSILDMDLIHLTHTCEPLSITNLGSWIFSAGEYWLFNWTFSSLGPLMESPVCLPVCLSDCLHLSVVNFNLHYNFGTFRESDFIFGMHTPLMMYFQTTPKSMTLWPWLWPLLYNGLFGLHCHLGHSISQIHLVHSKFGLNI